MIILLACVLSCTFAAGKSSFYVKIAPFATQSVQYGKGYTSTYGYGGILGSRFNVGKDFVLGTDIKYSSFKYSELDSDYKVVSFIPRIGFSIPISALTTVNINVGPAIQLRVIGQDKAFNLGADVYVGLAFSIYKKNALVIGLDADLGIQKDSFDISVEPMVGIAFVI